MGNIGSIYRELCQRGQALVEFALLLPFFLMMFFCMVYGGWVFTDYMTFSNIASSCARDAVINYELDENKNADYTKVVARHATDGVIASLRSHAFIWRPDKNGENNHYLSVTETKDPDTGDYAVKVIINADLDSGGSYLGKMVYNLLAFTTSDGNAAKVMKDFIKVEYIMYRDSPDDLTVGDNKK